MKKKSSNTPDIVEFMTKIQAQLAVLDQKLDSFMTKSLTELAQARAAQKPPQPVAHTPPTAPRPTEQRPGRPMYDVICFECGKDTQIPFKPSGDRPVYCKECFARRKAGGNAPKVNIAPSIVAAPAPVAAPKPVESTKKPAKPKKPVAKKKVVVKKKAKKK